MLKLAKIQGKFKNHQGHSSQLHVNSFQNLDDIHNFQGYINYQNLPHER